MVTKIDTRMAPDYCYYCKYKREKNISQIKLWIKKEKSKSYENVIRIIGA